MKIPNNKYLIEVSGLVNDHIITENGFKFYRDLTLQNREWYKNTEGTVIMTPEKHTEQSTRCTHVNRNGEREVLMHSRLPMVVQPGDKVYYNYLSLKPENQFIYDGYDPTNFQFFINGDDILAYERDGNLYANGGRVILEHINEEIVASKKIIIPNNYKKATGLAKVAATGPPFIGFNDPRLEIGDIVAYKKNEGDYINEAAKRFAVYYEFVYLVLK